MGRTRESWGSRWAVILAVAGSAVGLGNFLRFPGMAAANGGGAFMIPYFVALLLLGLPLMWIEWALGRYGGGFGHGTAPGIFHSVWRKNRFIKYFGVIGIFGPLVIFTYYTVIESWTLAYSWFAAVGALRGGVEFGAFFQQYIGVARAAPGETVHFASAWPAYLFFVATFAANLFVVWRGIRGGIGRLCTAALPALFLLALVLLVRIATLPPHEGRTFAQGLGYLWNPDFSRLADASVWMNAAGQIFFTLSVGIGVILTYASYLKKSDDVVLSGLTSTATNELAEVILGGSIVIPMAFIMLGAGAMQQVAQSSLFSLGFITMPQLLGALPLPSLMGCCWFGLLFLAGLTSSVSLAQPAVAFLEDEFDLSRDRAVGVFALVTFAACHAAFFFMGNGVVDELDTWGGNFCLVLFGTIEAILFAWVFGMRNAWDEMHHGAQLRIPAVYRFIIAWVTPLLLLALLGWWFYDTGWNTLLLKGVKPESRPYVIGTRAGLVVLCAGLALLVNLAWRRKARAAAVAAAREAPP